MDGPYIFSLSKKEGNKKVTFTSTFTSLYPILHTKNIYNFNEKRLFYKHINNFQDRRKVKNRFRSIIKEDGFVYTYQD